jgi:hypothetical protein
MAQAAKWHTDERERAQRQWRDRRDAGYPLQQDIGIGAPALK